MTIEQKAREIVELANLVWSDAIAGPDTATIAARFGIMEGRRQAFEEAAAVVQSEGHEGLATAIRALIEEQEV